MTKVNYDKFKERVKLVTKQDYSTMHIISQNVRAPYYIGDFDVYVREPYSEREQIEACVMLYEAYLNE